MVTINGVNLGSSLYAAFGSNFANKSAFRQTRRPRFASRHRHRRRRVAWWMYKCFPPADYRRFRNLPKTSLIYLRRKFSTSLRIRARCRGRRELKSSVTISAATAVNFELQAGTITSLYQNDPVTDLWTMIATAPPAFMYGISNVRVTTPGGISSLSSFNTPYYDDYFYIGQPSISAVSPGAGPLAGGTSVIIAGGHLDGAQQVLFGSTPATSFSYNPTTRDITAIAPAGLAGAVDISVLTPGGSSPATLADKFTYTVAPSVTGVSANDGAYEGGTTVTITGTNFTGASAVKFGGTSATSFTVVSSTMISAVSPGGALGNVDITVTTPGGSSSVVPADQFTYNSMPVVTGIRPLAGPLSGGTSLIIYGYNFAGATDLYFGGVDVSLMPAMINPSGTMITDYSVPGYPAILAGTPIYQMVDASNATGNMNLSLNSSDYGITTPNAWTFSITATNTGAQAYNNVEFVTPYLWDNATTPSTAARGIILLSSGPAIPTTLRLAPDTGSGPTCPYLPIRQTNEPLTWGDNVSLGVETAAFTQSFPAIPLGTIGPGDTVAFTLTCPANNFNPNIVGFFTSALAGTVDVTVASPNGTSTTSALDRFTYGSVPMVSSRCQHRAGDRWNHGEHLRRELHGRDRCLLRQYGRAGDAGHD